MPERRKRSSGKQIVVALCCYLLLAGATGVGAQAQERRRRLPAGAETFSLFGEPLFPPPLAPETRAQMEARLAEARARFAANPRDAEAIIWLGRRTAYLGHFRAAVSIYTRGISLHPRDARLYRHRGHRYISLREFDRAISDFERAARLIAGKPDEVEPDGLPNERNQPTSTLQSNIWYHLGLAYYLKGDFQSALRAYRACLEVSRNPDMLVATTHWLYMTLRRLNRAEEARRLLEPISAEMDIIENRDYHRLLLMYQGRIEPVTLLEEARRGSALASATVGYGVANWYLYNGRRADTVRIFREVLNAEQWASFGYIAAEADLRRLGERRR